MTSLAELFPGEDYRFHLTLRRGDPAAYFSSQDATGAVLAERARWLGADPRRYGRLEPEGEGVCGEFARMAADWSDRAAAPADVIALGRSFEPDILFLTADDDARFRLRGGALCFPTGWALEDKIGKPLEDVHAVVPGLNQALAAPIQQFLSRLKPGAAYLRDNWGITATDELNLHPARRIPPPALPIGLDQLWLRVEHQALLALPETRGIVFGIRIARHRLDDVVRAGFGRPLRRALETMPSQLVEYKRLAAIRAELLRLL